VSYLCANFSLPRLLCCQVRSDVCDRQTDRQTDITQTSDVRQKQRLMPPPYVGGGIISNTHRVPHDNVDVCEKRTIDMLRYIDIDKVAEMMIHVDT